MQISGLAAMMVRGSSMRTMSSCTGAIFKAGAWSTLAPRRSKASMRSLERRCEVTPMRKPSSGASVASETSVAVVTSWISRARATVIDLLSGFKERSRESAQFSGCFGMITVGFSHPDHLAYDQHGRVAATGGCRFDRTQTREGGVLARAVPPFHPSHRHVGFHPRPAQAGGKLREGSDAHEDNDRAPESRQVRVFLLRQGSVSGNHGEHVADLAVRYRNSRCGRNGDGARDAGDHADGNASGNTGGHFFATAAKDVWIAALEPDHVLAQERSFHHEFFDVTLRDLVVSRLLSNVHQLAGRQVCQLLVWGQAIVKHDVGIAQGVHRTNREEIQGARTTAHQGHVTLDAWCRLEGNRNPGAAAAFPQRLPAGVAVVHTATRNGRSG